MYDEERMGPGPSRYVCRGAYVHRPNGPDSSRTRRNLHRIVESSPPIHGEIRPTDTLRLVFDYNIDGYDYCADCEYYFWFSYRRC